MSKPTPLHIRYERHIDRNGPNGCWIWTGSGNKAGYGQFRIGRSNQGNPVISVHRWSYEHHKGPIPEGQIVRHRCDNPRCSNPEHLVLGTHKDNSDDKLARNPNVRGYKRPPMSRQRKLTDEQVRKIKHLLKINMFKVETLAEFFGVGVSAIYSIRSGRTKSLVK